MRYEFNSYIVTNIIVMVDYNIYYKMDHGKKILFLKGGLHIKKLLMHTNTSPMIKVGDIILQALM